MVKPYPYFISLSEAREVLEEHLGTITSEILPLDKCLGRTLFSSVKAQVNDPPFDNSSMDGFAVIYNDTLSPPTKLSIIGQSMAGKGNITASLTNGQACKIMTGAPMPEGADSIIPIEDCEIKGGNVILHKTSKPHYVRNKGENFQSDQIIFSKGDYLGPEQMSLCAASGNFELSVVKKLRFAVISTGDELKSKGEKLDYGEIYESNSYGICGLIESYGHHAVKYDSVIDDIDSLRKTLNHAAENCDVIITSGGVSMGDRDFVRKIMEEEGDIKFWRVKMRPGSPPIFGHWYGKPIFGLPGNPVSSHVVFRALVAHWIRKTTGSEKPKEIEIDAKLAHDFKTSPNFTTFRRVSVYRDNTGYIAELKGHQGSGNIAGIAHSDGLTILGPESKGLAGEICRIMLL